MSRWPTLRSHSRIVECISVLDKHLSAHVLVEELPRVVDDNQLREAGFEDEAAVYLNDSIVYSRY